MNNFHRFITILLLSFSFVSFLVNYNVFNSYMLQYQIIEEFNTKSFNINTFKKFKTLNLNFPNVSVTGLPLVPMLANYHSVSENYSEALTLLDKNINDNNFIGFRDALKSEIFYKLKVSDSSLFYAKKAYFKIPQNPVHFERLVIAYGYEKKYDSIVSAFEYVDHESKDIWKLFLATMLTSDSIQTLKAKNLSKIAKKRFNNDAEILTLANSILFGKNNVEKSYLFREKAENFYNLGDYKKASEFYEQASILNPGSYSFFENAAASYLMTGDYEKVIYNTSIVLDSFHITTGKSEFLRANAFKELKDMNQACIFYRRSYKNGFKNAYPYINKFCK